MLATANNRHCLNITGFMMKIHLTQSFRARLTQRIYLCQLFSNQVTK